MDIRLESVSKVYRLGVQEVRAVWEVSLGLPNGDMVCFSGPSGAGKSTLLNLIGGLEKPDAGSVIAGSLESRAQAKAATEPTKATLRIRGARS